MNIINIIEHKRDKKELTKGEIEYFVKGYTDGNITDYQAAALIMAIYINGMNKNEISDLTMAMVESGERLDLSDISNNIVDKHSTGGVGDKITLILMPIMASLGIPVAKMSGRGLGFTGGTVDKLESIPGMNVDLSIEELKKNVKEIGISLITSNMNLAPADKKMYALRNSIGCTSSIALIASSIMSKKIAAGGNKILINITCGDGAFMKDVASAKKLAIAMIEIGKNAGKEVKCVITSMDEPVGYAVGNQLEIVETIKSLRGNMPDDIKELVYTLGAQMLKMAGKIEKISDAKKLIDDAISSGKAYEKFKEVIKKQGGDVSYIEDYSKFKCADNVIPVLSENDGFIKEIKTELIGSISSFIGAGRNKKEDDIDHRVGIVMNKKIGDSINTGEPLAFIHINDKDKLDSALRNINDAFVISKKKVAKKSTIIEIL